MHILGTNKMFAAILTVQAACLVVLAFGDIGFDIRGRFGLSIEHGVLLAAVYFGSLSFGIILSVKRKQWLPGILQLLGACALTAFTFWPAQAARAIDYQYLVGQSKEAVERELGTQQIVSGIMNDGQQDLEFADCKGLTVYYDADGTVVRIAPNRTD